MTANRMTGRKEISLVLHKMNNSISYSDVRFNILISKLQISKRMVKHLPTDVSIDNNNGREETVAGKGTSYYTNRTMLQPLLRATFSTLFKCLPYLCKILTQLKS